MIRFTPKPWKMSSFERQGAKPYRVRASEGVTEPYRITHSRSGYNFAVVIWSLGGKMAEIFNRQGSVTREKMLANGRLMTVSPDMYDMLKIVLTATAQDKNKVIADIDAILAYVDGTGDKP